jgi:hypothetical protein
MRSICSTTIFWVATVNFDNPNPRLKLHIACKLVRWITEKSRKSYILSALGNLNLVAI